MDNHEILIMNLRARIGDLEARMAELEELLDLHIDGTNKALEANHRLGIAAFNA